LQFGLFVKFLETNQEFFKIKVANKMICFIDVINIIIVSILIKKIIDSL